MSDIYINGEKKTIHNLGEHATAKDFFEHPDNRHVVGDYLKEAERNGKAEFFAGGQRYEIRSEETEGGKKEFSVHKYHR